MMDLLSEGNKAPDNLIHHYADMVAYSQYEGLGLQAFSGGLVSFIPVSKQRWHDVSKQSVRTNQYLIWAVRHQGRLLWSRSPSLLGDDRAEASLICLNSHGFLHFITAETSLIVFTSQTERVWREEMLQVSNLRLLQSTVEHHETSEGFNAQLCELSPGPVLHSFRCAYNWTTRGFTVEYSY